MSEGSSTAKPDRAELEAAIDALLAEIDATCARFEKPEDAEDDSDLDEYAGAAAAIAGDGQAEPGASAESALNVAETSASALLEDAADRLVESLEAGVRSAGSQTPPPADAEPGPDATPPDAPIPASNERLLDQAVGTLLDTLGADAGTDDQADADEAAGSDPSKPGEDAGGDDDAASALLDGAALDALLEGSFESATGETVDTNDLDTRPDPSLMLDTRPEAPEMPVEPGPVAPEPAVPEPAASEPVVAEPGPTPERAVSATPAPAARPQPRLDRLLAWLRPRAAAACRAVAEAVKPVGARALLVLSRPLENKPPAVRDSIGWVALWTVFLAVCVWAYAVLRPAPTPADDGQGSRVVSAEVTPGP